MHEESASSGEAALRQIGPQASPIGRSGHFLGRWIGLGEPFRIKETTLLLTVSVFMALAFNTAFFAKLIAIYPLSFRYLLFHFSVLLIVVALTAFLLILFSSKYTTKPLAVLLIFASALVNYFVNQYGIVVDAVMLQNVFETDLGESLDLLTVPLGLHALFLGVLPGVIVWRLQGDYRRGFSNVLRKSGLAASALALIALALFGSASTFASFFREYKAVRAYVNPAGYIYAVGKLVASSAHVSAGAIQPYAADARRDPLDHPRRLVIFVVGETARADHFSLNGYARKTNPLLEQEDIVNFSNVMSAGTSTSVSVPAMFSHLTREDYDDYEARHTENVVDILSHVGVSVLWRENNSDSKSVATRVAYEDFKSPDRNPISEGEPRDEGMLVDLQEYIDQQAGDVLVVLHTMGNHGPAYYKRYPAAFEVFTPVCHSNQLEECSQEEINNAYDNAILYTDYFLSQVIRLLERNDDSFETAMLYFSDHGESLGENNMYLHGYPYAFAPLTQKHVPAVFWFGRRFPIDLAAIRARSSDPYAHDHIFHTLLGLFEVKTDTYIEQLDMVSPYLTDEP